jgi:hypothetical protein
MIDPNRIENKELLNAIISKAVTRPVSYVLQKSQAVRLRTMLYEQRKWLMNKHPSLNIGFEITIKMLEDGLVRITIQPQFFDLEQQLQNQDEEVASALQLMRKQKQELLTEITNSTVQLDLSVREKAGSIGLIPQEVLTAKEISLDELIQDNTSTNTQEIITKTFNIPG